MTSFSFLSSIILLALLVFGGVALVLVAVLATRGRGPSGPPRPMAVPSPPPNREARVRILQQLADRRINVDEAEVRLAAMGNPVPAAIPIGSAPASSSSNKGCLIAALIAMGLVGLLVFAVVVLSFVGYTRVQSDFGPGVRFESLQTNIDTVDSETEVAESPQTNVTEETIEEREEDSR